jgi:hypothetical protein
VAAKSPVKDWPKLRCRATKIAAAVIAREVTEVSRITRLIFR